MFLCKAISGGWRFKSLFLSRRGAIAEVRDLVQVIEQDLLDDLLNRLISILVELLHVLLLEDDLGPETRSYDHIFILTVLHGL